MVIRRLLIAFAGVALALALPPSSRADAVCSPPNPRATVLLIHGGGFLTGDAGLMIPECRAFAARGYRAVSLEYPLANLPAARAYAFVAADHYRAGGRVYALGSSSGGTLAVLLALEGRVDGAVAAGPMVDLLHEPSCANFWTRDFCHKLRRVADTRTRRRLSPAFVRPHHAAPLVLVQDPHDIVIDFRKTAAFARRYHLPLIRSDQGHAWSVRIELRAFDLMLGLKA